MRTLLTIDSRCGSCRDGCAPRRRTDAAHDRRLSAVRLCGRRPAAHGFTLAEILVIVALLGLLATSSGNVAYSTYRRFQVEKAARQLYLAARYARIFAVERHMYCRLVLDKTNRRFFITAERADMQGVDGAARIIANSYTKPTELPGLVEFEQINVLSGYATAAEGITDGAVITFYPDGTADMSAIQIGDGESHFAVYVLAATGKVQVQFGLASETPVDVVDLDMEGY
ncbi:MAG: hypothetical protein IH624_10620 [Phycisphaerae bacterium]|nr:hypothetical protein [Phycisphaerae bacterium]